MVLAQLLAARRPPQDHAALLRVALQCVVHPPSALQPHATRFFAAARGDGSSSELRASARLGGAVARELARGPHAASRSALSLLDAASVRGRVLSERLSALSAGRTDFVHDIEPLEQTRALEEAVAERIEAAQREEEEEEEGGKEEDAAGRGAQSAAAAQQEPVAVAASEAKQGRGDAEEEEAAAGKGEEVQADWEEKDGEQEPARQRRARAASEEPASATKRRRTEQPDAEDEEAEEDGEVELVEEGPDEDDAGDLWAY
jgi:hypothetical protein